MVYTPLWRPLLYALRRGPIVDATAHERRLRGDGFGDGFGGDFLRLGRSTGGDSAPVLASTAPSEVGSPGSLRLRVAGSSPASGASLGAAVSAFLLFQDIPYNIHNFPGTERLLQTFDGAEKLGILP